jgi:preprotein translocase subunit SecG
MQVLNIFHVLIAIAMVAFILVQRGPGATAGAAFGSGASGTVFGSRGAGSFLSRSTWILGMLFCVISLSMAVIVSRTVSTPDTELGVVGEAQPEVTVPSGDPAVAPGLDDVSQDSDLPELDTSNEVQEQGDLPQLDDSADAVSEPEGDLPDPPSGGEPGGNG